MTHLATDVLVIGAGPAGSAAARTLAALGHKVILVDRHAAPRDKTCGDALIPDALDALTRLGLKDRVLSEACTTSSMRICAPDGTCVDIAGTMACLPRLRLDQILVEAARETGAQLLAPYALRTSIHRGESIAGAAFIAGSGGAPPLTVEARFTILATGAAVRPLEVFGVCTRHSASAVAARVYVRAPEQVARAYRHLCISYDREIAPGYGWIFPCPENTFNVGVGYFTDSWRSAPRDTNLRRLLDRFVATFAPAKGLMAAAEPLTQLRGAPLRTALTGSELARPGLLVAGEAAGLTYSFSGEGIGKAIASGITAGEVVGRALAGNGDAVEVARSYSAQIKADFAERFRAYRVAQAWLSWPWLANLVARRANAGDYVQRQLEGLLAETIDPRELFSIRGLLKGLVA